MTHSAISLSPPFDHNAIQFIELQKKKKKKLLSRVVVETSARWNLVLKPFKWNFLISLDQQGKSAFTVFLSNGDSFIFG